jgi:hypothetical protein
LKAVTPQVINSAWYEVILNQSSVGDMVNNSAADAVRHAAEINALQATNGQLVFALTNAQEVTGTAERLLRVIDGKSADDAKALLVGALAQTMIIGIRLREQLDDKVGRGLIS